MDYQEYIQKDRYAIKIEFEGKLGQKNKDFLWDMISDYAHELMSKLEIDGSVGEITPTILPKDIVESI
jgi:hypothetical protein